MKHLAGIFLGCARYAAIAMLAATPANAEDIRAIVADLSQDWTHLSPRIHCLGEAGLKRGSYSTYMPESPARSGR